MFSGLPYSVMNLGLDKAIMEADNEEIIDYDYYRGFNFM